MSYFLGLSTDTWGGAILGAILGAIIIPLVWAGLNWIKQCWRESRPRIKVLDKLADNGDMCTIFVRDFHLASGSNILAVDPLTGIGVVQNVNELWADVDGRAISYVFNAIGQAGKRRNISVVRMSQDTGIWNTNIIVIGAQAQKSFNFYSQMKDVTYSVDANDIHDIQKGSVVPRDSGFGYGIILKTINPHKVGTGAGVGLLIGGYGTLGTAAAAYYFREHLEELGKLFGSDCFGVVVRASVTAGEQSVERLPQYDRKVG